jgi:hypothetical protein
MKTDESITTEAYLKSDEQAVLAHLVRGTPLDPEAYQRIRARAEAITERLRRQHGEMNIAVDLIRETREEG